MRYINDKPVLADCTDKPVPGSTCLTLVNTNTGTEHANTYLHRLMTVILQRPTIS